MLKKLWEKIFRPQCGPTLNNSGLFSVDIECEVRKMREESELIETLGYLDEALCLLEEIYDWTAYKNSKWALKVRDLLNRTNQIYP